MTTDRHHRCLRPLSRRGFLGAAATVAACAGCRTRSAGRRPRILVRSSWQVVNIGDIAHTPGLLALLERFIPEAEIRLWSSADLSEPVSAMLKRRFPDLDIVKGNLRGGGGTGPDGAAGWADLLLHGSGPSFVAHRDVAEWVRRTGKPFGIFGITYGGAEPPVRELMNRAAFVFFRDSVSLAKARKDGVNAPVMEWGPDAAFACDVRDEAAAEAWLRTHGLETGRFVCCIPRLRFTPYWRIKSGAAMDADRHRRNEEMKDSDHAPLREAVGRLVRDLGLRVLLCPEDMSQVEVGREMILERLPPDVRRGVVWREKFWLTDEAASVYARSRGLFGLEMHSPILCIGMGVPAIVGRFAEQTSKGFMWRDIGLADWLFDFDVEADRLRYPAAVAAMVRDHAASLRRAGAARERVRARHAAAMRIVRRSLPSG